MKLLGGGHLSIKTKTTYHVMPGLYYTGCRCSQLLRMFGKYGQGRGELDQPGVAVDTDGMVYLSEGQSQ